MSVLCQLNIAPPSNTKKYLNDIQRFISELIKDGFIIDEFVILAGESENIRNVSTWDFNGNSISSGISSISKLKILENTDFDSLIPNENYAFKVLLTKNHPELKNFDVFKSTDEAFFPMFISYLAEPFNYEFYNGDEEEYEKHELVNINCILRSDGRNSKALWDILEKQNSLTSFFEKIDRLFDGFIAGSMVE